MIWWQYKESRKADKKLDTHNKLHRIWFLGQNGRALNSRLTAISNDSIRRDVKRLLKELICKLNMTLLQMGKLDEDEKGHARAGRSSRRPIGGKPSSTLHLVTFLSFLRCKRRPFLGTYLIAVLVVILLLILPTRMCKKEEEGWLVQSWPCSLVADKLQRGKKYDHEKMTVAR